MELTATHLISLPNTSITRLAAGVREPLGRGTLQVHLLSFPVAPLPASELDSPPNFAAVTSTLDPTAEVASTDQGQCLLLSLQSEAVRTGQVGQSAQGKFELPLAQTTQVVGSPNGGYFIPFDGGFSPRSSPRASPAPDGEEEGTGFVEVSLALDLDEDERDSFEEILAGLTRFQRPAYEMAEDELRNQLVLVDAEGAVVGKLESDLAEDPSLAIATAEDDAAPVLISTGADGELTASKWSPVDNPTNSSIVNFANYVSGGVVYGSEWAADHLTRAGDRATSVPRDANGKELTFSPIAKRGAQAGLKITQTALTVSGKTVGLIASAAAGVGDKLGRSLGIQSTAGGKPPSGIRGLVNRSLVAVNTVADSLEYGGKALLTAGGTSANQVIAHKYGSEAGALSASVGNSAKHVALIYIDVRGIQRRALLKTVGKSALRAKMKDGSIVELEPESEEEVKALAERDTSIAPLLPARKGEKMSPSPPPLPPRDKPTSPGAGAGGKPPIPARPVMDSKNGL